MKIRRSLETHIRLVVVCACLGFLVGCGGSSGGGGASVVALGTLSKVTYTDRSTGETMTVDAIPGVATVLFSPSLSAQQASELVSMIETHGGVVQEVNSTFGYAVVNLSPGSEGSFIDVLGASPLVIGVYPELLGATHQFEDGGLESPPIGLRATSPVAATSRPYVGQIDDFSDTAQRECGNIRHGDAGKGILESSGQPVTEQVPKAPNGALNLSALARDSLPQTFDRLANLGTSRPIVNISIGGSANADYLKTQQAFLGMIGDQINTAIERGLDPIVVVSAGNGATGSGAPGTGVNLTGLLNKLASSRPGIFDHLVVVGSTGKKGDCTKDTGLNFADPGAPGMVYVPGREVSIPGKDPPCAPDGTSFAAPQVANSLLEAAGRDPTATSASLIRDLSTNGAFIDCQPSILLGTWTGSYTSRVVGGTCASEGLQWGNTASYTFTTAATGRSGACSGAFNQQTGLITDCALEGYTATSGSFEGTFTQSGFSLTIGSNNFVGTVTGKAPAYRLTLSATVNSAGIGDNETTYTLQKQ